MSTRRSQQAPTSSRSPRRWARRGRRRWTNADSDEAHADARAERLAPRVLVAEDDPDMRRLIRSGLRRDGCDVLEASDGNELLNLLSALVLKDSELGPVDLIISDVRMPGHSGLEALRALRRVDPATPVVLITAFGDAELHAEADRLGAAAVFDKPFDLDDLRTLVRNCWFLPTPAKLTT